MANTWDEILEIFKAKGPVSDKELMALKANTQLLEYAEAAPQLKSVLVRFASSLEKLSDASGKSELNKLAKLLNSDKLEERVVGMRKYYDVLNKLSDTKGSQAYREMIVRVIKDIGPETLRKIPQFEHSFQRYRKRYPDSNPSFEDFLRNSQSARMRLALKGLLTTDPFKTANSASKIYSPALSSIEISQKAADDLIAALARAMDVLPEKAVLDMLFRKLGTISSTATRDQLSSLVKAGQIIRKIADSDVQKLFKMGLRRNLQGNVGEALAFSKQVERLKIASDNGGKPIYLAMDVRVSGRRTIVDKNIKKAPGDTSVPARDTDVSELEFSDDLIVDLGNPPNMKIVEHHETKVTRQSVNDGVNQIDDNRERMEFATKLSIGEIYKWENGKLTKVNLDDIPGFKPQAVAGGEKRLVIEETKDFVEAAKKREKAFDQEVRKIDDMKHLTPEEQMARKRALYEKFAASEKDARRIGGINNSKKILFTPEDQIGIIPGHTGIENVPLDFTYKNIIDFCNLLFLRAGFTHL